MAEPVTYPNFLLPQMGFNTGHKPISGGTYNIFATAGQYFGFNPQFKFDIGGGDYIPQNNTFSPGKYYSVSTDP